MDNPAGDGKETPAIEPLVNTSTTTISAPEAGESTKKPPRSYEELSELLKTGKAVVMSSEEGKVFTAGKAAEEKQVKEREEAVTRRYYKMINTIFQNLLVQTIIGGIYMLWTIIPIIGIVMGLIYIKHDNCPGRPGTAPHLIGIGVLALIGSITLGYRANKSKNKDKEEAGTGSRVQNPKKKESDDEFVELGESGPGLQTQQPKPQITIGSCCFGCCCCCFLVFIKIAHFALLISTSVIVYKFAPEVNYVKTGIPDEDNKYYCNEILFMFAFWSLTFPYIIIGIIIIIFVIFTIVYFCMLQNAESGASETAPKSSNELNC